MSRKIRSFFKFAVYHFQNSCFTKQKKKKKQTFNLNETKNIFIEGENLEVLKILQGSYFGQIKAIYIDPPYNTGSDLIYQDKFSIKKSDYQKRLTETDKDGNLLIDSFFRKNQKENGHYHSDWLSMIYPRLFLARNLLKENGVIFVSIDDNEVHNLRLVMNEIFGEENFVGDLIRKTKSTTNDKKHGFNIQHENTLIFAKDITKINLQGEEKDLSKYKNPDNDPKGSWISADPTASRTGISFPILNPFTKKVIIPPQGSSWRFSKKNFEKYVQEGKIKFLKVDKKGERGFIFKRYLNELKSSKHLVNSLAGVDNQFMNQAATKSLKKLFPEFKAFEFSKPSKFIETILKTVMTKDEDIVLDFFAGSGTTAEAIFNLNQEDGITRQFICVQIAEKCSPKSEAFQKGYLTITQIAEERIERVVKKLYKYQKENFDFAKQRQNLDFKFFKLAKSNFQQWNEISKEQKNTPDKLKFFVNNINNQAKDIDIVYELLLKNHFSLNAKIVKKEGFFLINDNDLAIVIENCTADQFKKIIECKPNKIIVLDQAFVGNDELKINLSLQLKEKNIDFETI